MADLLLEIGTEELPPLSIRPALEQLAEIARRALDAARLQAGEVRTAGTVRRLVLMVSGIAAWQRDAITVVRGPAAKIAYDGAGRPTQAAIGFARSQGVPAEALQVREIEGGRYVVAERREIGRPAAEVLRNLLPALVPGLSFPKPMRWRAGAFRFGRPIRWIVALLDGRIIPLEIAGVRAGRRTLGHRFLAPGAVNLPRAGAYAGAVRRARVVLDPQERRRRIVDGATSLARTLGGRPVLDPNLLEELVWSTEHPTPLLGTFDAHLTEALPRPVVLVTLQHHQKSFGVDDTEERLLPAFIAVRDGGTAHMATVRKGHEWVVQARLADAQFFLNEDRRAGFDRWNAALSRVAHVAGLGSVADHVARIRQVAAWLAQAAGASEADRKTLARAAELCKADLVTAMVGEFPELQGTIGRLYALERGESADVARAIEEHYWPKAAGADPPGTLPGALLGIADRAVLLSGALLAGLEPTGSQDPYGLRRATSGIVAVLLAQRLAVGLGALFAAAADTYHYPQDARDRAQGACVEFVLGRLRTTLTDQGLVYDTVDAVLAAGGDDVADLAARARALHEVRAQPVMARLVTGYTRAMNILRQARSGGLRLPSPDPQRLAEPAEIALHRAWQEVSEQVDQAARAGRYAEVLHALARLADPVDRFFDDVLVMAPDEQVRVNRLALLQAITGSFLRVADLSKLSG